MRLGYAQTLSVGIAHPTGSTQAEQATLKMPNNFAHDRTFGHNILIWRLAIVTDD